MPQIIKDNQIVNDHWQIIPRDFDGDLPSAPCLVHIATWQALKEQGRSDIAPWLDSDDDVESFTAALTSEPLIAVHFPTFMDGRGFSTARLLRERYGFSGELRAIGYVIQDQLYFLKRCGFDAYDLRDGTDLQAALKSLQDFNVQYQTAADSTTPLFRRRHS